MRHAGGCLAGVLVGGGVPGHGGHGVGTPVPGCSTPPVKHAVPPASVQAECAKDIPHPHRATTDYNLGFSNVVGDLFRCLVRLVPFRPPPVTRSVRDAGQMRGLSHWQGRVAASEEAF